VIPLEFLQAFVIRKLVLVWRYFRDLKFSGVGWLRGTVVERRSMTGELSLSYARPVADG